MFRNSLLCFGVVLKWPFSSLSPISIFQLVDTLSKKINKDYFPFSMYISLFNFNSHYFNHYLIQIHCDLPFFEMQVFSKNVKTFE